MRQPDEPIVSAAIEQRYRPIVRALEDAFAHQLKTVVLFGSQARGEAHPGSDHDLLVVVEGLPREPLARLRVVRATLLPVLSDLPGPVSFVAKTPEEVAENLTPLLLDVCVEGVCLYGTTYFEPYRRKAWAALRHSGLQRRKVGNTLIWLFPRLPASDWELNWEGYRESR